MESVIRRISGKGYVLNLEWKTLGVMDSDSGDDGRDEFTWVG